MAAHPLKLELVSLSELLQARLSLSGNPVHQEAVIENLLAAFCAKVSQSQDLHVEACTALMQQLSVLPFLSKRKEQIQCSIDAKMTTGVSQTHVKKANKAPQQMTHYVQRFLTS